MMSLRAILGERLRILCGVDELIVEGKPQTQRELFKSIAGSFHC